MFDLEYLKPDFTLFVLMINVFYSLPELSTERLFLRQLKPTDRNAIYTLRNDASVNAYIDRPGKTTIEEAEKFIVKINTSIENNQSLYWAVTLKGSDNLIGTICLWNISVEENKVEIGYELMQGQQGKGLMQEALRRVVDYAFETMYVKRIEAYTHKDNKRSEKLLLNNNFRQEGAVADNEMEIIFVLEK